MTSEALAILRYIWLDRMLPTTEQVWSNVFPWKNGPSMGLLLKELEDAKMVEISAPCTQYRYVMLTETGTRFCRTEMGEPK